MLFAHSIKCYAIPLIRAFYYCLAWALWTAGLENVSFWQFFDFARAGFRHLLYALSLEFVTGGVELLKAVLHGYAGGLIFMK